MKSNYTLTKIIKTLSLVVLCMVFANSVPVHAAQQASSTGEYDLRLQLAEDAALDPEEFPEYILMLQEMSTEKYLIAEYNSAQNCYQITSSTVEKEKATGFTFVAQKDGPAVVLISGLAEGRYSLTCAKAPNGRQPLSPTEIILSANSAEIDGVHTEYLDGSQTLAADFYIFWGYELPGDPHHNIPREVITVLGIVMVVTAVSVLFFVLMKKD